MSLHKVTDDFIAHIRSYGRDWDLDQASHFLLVAATLLDLKAARLLPSGEVDDEDDLALLEARDLLFARLLQYRAYKEVAQVLAARIAEARAVPAPGADGAEVREPAAGGAARPRPGPVRAARREGAHAEGAARGVGRAIYQPKASVKEQAAIVVALLRRLRRTTFRVLAADAEGTYEVVARFLAVLELYREQAVTFEQDEPSANCT